ncbi:MAG: hypothetical protein QOC65_897 [Sphingomonadales bacterium]|nr:hypothetical protein [Sphingomonadales bacterium]
MNDVGEAGGGGAVLGPLDFRRVMAALPHRYPMLLVDAWSRLSSTAVSPRSRR